ncbi:hypothetical protein [Actinoplanes subglobosus]|uniref:MFS transporter n=1 Tax=Actinoplanes subglobosus TaxID=1547892 RepID=A0ABV8J162_9ACTN
MTGQPGCRLLAAGVGPALGYLGVVSLVLPDAIGGWGRAGGALGCAAGLTYLAVAVPWRRLRPAPVPGAV